MLTPIWLFSFGVDIGRLHFSMPLEIREAMWPALAKEMWMEMICLTSGLRHLRAGVLRPWCFLLQKRLWKPHIEMTEACDERRLDPWVAAQRTSALRIAWWLHFEQEINLCCSFLLLLHNLFYLVYTSFISILTFCFCVLSNSERDILNLPFWLGFDYFFFF